MIPVLTFWLNRTRVFLERHEAWRPASPALSRTAATLSIVLLLFAVQGVIRFGAQINHDTAWFIHIANGLLDGKRLYVDFVEVNPPLAIWLIVPSTALARLCGIEPDQGLYGVLFALTAVSLALSARYLRDEAQFRCAAYRAGAACRRPAVRSRT